MSAVNWLSGAEIERYVTHNADENTKSIYLGIFSLDTLPSKVYKYPLLLIVNSDTSNLPGKHWRAVYIAENLRGEIFDPLGVAMSLQLECWMNSFTVKWTRTYNFIQHPLSPSCGAFVLHFVLKRMQYDTLDNYLSNNFVDNLSFNENVIKSFVKSLRK